MALRKGRHKTAAKNIASPDGGKTSLSVNSLPKSKKPSTEISIGLKRATSPDWAIQQLKRQFSQQVPSPMPQDLKPMLASVAQQPFNDADWQFEIKWDGYRAISYISKNKAELRSRNNLSFNAKFADIHKALKAWPVHAVVDGEVVVVNEEGKADFAAIQSWHKQPKGHLLYYVFDLLWIEGVDLQNEPLWKRQEVLRKIMPQGGPVRFSESIEEYGIDFFKAAKDNGLEGIIAKQKNSAYQTGDRTNNWYKIKAETRHEAVICGYTRKKDSDRLFSSLILGIPNKNTIEFIGQVGTGFTQSLQASILQQLKPLLTNECPFEKSPKINDAVQWAIPEIICEVKYTERTKDGVMRHPSFQGIREDKTMKDFNAEPALKNEL